MASKNLLTLVDEEITRLQLVRSLLAGESTANKNGVAPHGTNGKSANGAHRRVMSAEARERIASAQRKRWAAVKKAAKKAAKL